MKKCTKCKNFLDLNLFSKLKRSKDGYQSQCKSCVKEYQQKNKEMINETRRKNYNPEKNSMQCLDYYNRNKEKVLKKVKEYQDKNKEKRKEYFKNYKKNRLANDILYSLKEGISCLIRNSMNRNYVKKSKTEVILGCSYEYFKNHIEKQFLSGMIWDNRSEWHIDHIIPLSSAKTEDDVLKLNHFTNLRPLWAKDNLAKGGKVETLL